MIEIVTAKDLLEVWTKIQELIERTKNHTLQIHEIQRQVKAQKQEEHKR